MEVLYLIGGFQSEEYRVNGCKAGLTLIDAAFLILKPINQRKHCRGLTHVGNRQAAQVQGLACLVQLP